MALIYNKTVTGGETKKTMIVGGRQSFLRQINNNNWNTIRIGMFWGITTLSDTDGAISDEHINILSPKDMFFFGLKQVTDISNPTAEPFPDGSASGANFVGIGSRHDTFNGTQFSYFAANDGSRIMGYYSAQGYTLVAGAAAPNVLNFNGTGVPGGAQTFQMGYGSTGPNFGTDTNFAVFDGVEIIRSFDGVNSLYNVNHRGANEGSGNINFSINKTNAYALMRQELGNTFSANNTNYVITVPGALPNLNGFFVRWPFLNSRLKIYAYGWEVIN